MQTKRTPEASGPGTVGPARLATGAIAVVSRPTRHRLFPSATSKIRKTFGHESEAKLWRADDLYSYPEARCGRRRRPRSQRHGQPGWRGRRQGRFTVPGGALQAEGDPRIQARDATSGPPEFGEARVADLSRPDLQDHRGVDCGRPGASTVQVTVYRFGRSSSGRSPAGSWINRCTGLDMPAFNDRRERFADPARPKP